MNELQLQKPILIGGSGSSGSTLLATILDRHPEIACGPEMSFFNKHPIYGPYFVFQRKLPVWLKKGLSTDGYFPYYGFLLGREHYCLTEDLVIRWSTESNSLMGFVSLLQSHYLAHRGKTYFAENTPSNVYCFHEFVNVFPNCRLVHIVRDGRDVVCSLRKRGFPLFQASSEWLYNTAAGFVCRTLPQYLEIRYEDLVSNPEHVIKKVCDHIGVEFVPSMLEASTQGSSKSGLSSWYNSPSGPISTKSVGRYRQELVGSDLAYFYHVRLTSSGVRRLGAGEQMKPFSSFDLLRQLGYASTEELLDKPISISYRTLSWILDHLQRNIHSLRRGEGVRPLLTRINLL